ncbi:hypothetical protein [Vulcanococcus sp.]|uniref:hypothetical protein n=1 Tax=Vulcanococcus sp. TaxID=2856995 RepID=UPI003F6A228D
MRLLPASLHALIISGSILIGAGKGEAATPGLRFVVIPKVTHLWFEAVHGGAKAAAQMIQGQTNTPVVIDDRPPAKAEAHLQAARAECHRKLFANYPGIKVVALDDLPELLNLIQGGVADSTAASRPISQGYGSVLTLWQQSLGAPPIQRIDTGISVLGVTPESAGNPNRTQHPEG